LITTKSNKLLSQLLENYYILRLKKDQWKSLRHLRKIQLKKLKAIIKHAYNYVPYYHRSFSRAKIKPEDIRDFKDLTKIPLTSKQDVKENYQDILTRGLETTKLFVGFTSGSTGVPLKFFYDYSSKQYLSASEKYPFFECGVKLSDNFVTVWGRGRQSIVFGKKYVRLLGTLRETIVPLFSPEKLVKILRNLKPDVLNTFPSVVATLADYDTYGINPRLIFTQGEVVTPECRDIAQHVFGSELFETYGSVEFGSMAFECNEHYGLHMITHTTYIEFIDEDGEHVCPGERGEIIVTGLCNRAMPLIRYRIGDVGVPSNEKCPCGRGWPLIKSVEGRLNDYLILPSGRKLSWLYFARAFRQALVDEKLKENILHILQYQIIQERKNRITLKIVKEKSLNLKLLEQVRSRLSEYFMKQGENIDIAIQITNQLPIGRTGKRKVFISKLKD